MYAVSVGFAVFGAAVCVCGLVAARRPRLSTNEAVHSPHFKTGGTTPVLPVATFAIATIEVGSQVDGDVDIHGVEAESDLKKSHVITPRGDEDTDDEGATDE